MTKEECLKFFDIKDLMYLPDAVWKLLNSPTKERVANKGKMSAFLKVGKQVSFSLDLPNLLPSIIRDVASVADAESKLTLQVDQIRYAQFWWMKASQLFLWLAQVELLFPRIFPKYYFCLRI